MKLAMTTALLLATLPLSTAAASRVDEGGDVVITYEAPCGCKPTIRGSAVEGYLLVLDVTPSPSLNCSAGYFGDDGNGAIVLLGGCEPLVTVGGCTFEGSVTLWTPEVQSPPPFDILKSYQCGEFEFFHLNTLAQIIIPGTSGYAAVFAFGCGNCEQSF